MQLKTDTYYDIQCNYCGRNMSSDFYTGMAPTKAEAICWARELGFKTKLQKNICPICIKNQKDKITKSTNTKNAIDLPNIRTYNINNK